jgi:hypothetical protein
MSPISGLTFHEHLNVFQPLDEDRDMQQDCQDEATGCFITGTPSATTRLMPYVLETMLRATSWRALGGLPRIEAACSGLMADQLL